ncbi:major facilitator superfamily domain-containing protein 10 [Toxorhynchites rutilus septentrionalis]|uniref:major facilitator superfamily domain-containing protein 10 n=1 Tax=Toxorhynchites rutilus septentrionalis TaxID=329112 RepID=UPI00247A7184|nr:major facilitator superfamily domain-containing protein 10 [Toxorhynchites rutilus septentrionalis]
MTYPTMNAMKKRSGMDPSNANINDQKSESERENSITSNNTVGSTKTHPSAYLIFVSLLLDLLAFTMILPLLPSMLEYYKKNDTGGLYGYLSDSIRSFQHWLGAPERFNSVLFGGALGSLFSFLQFIVSPIAGGLSDIYGRKPVLILCAIGIAASYGLWAYSYNFSLFILARVVGGLSKGNISICMAILTDVSNERNRGKAMALVGIAFSLGFIVGPMIGAIFSKYSDKNDSHWFWLPATFAMGLASVNVVFIALCLKESLPKVKRTKKITHTLANAADHISITSLFKFSAVPKLSKHDKDSLRRLGLIYFIYLFIYSGLEFTITFLMYHKFNYTSIDQAKMFLTTGVIMALLQGSVVRRLPQHLTQKSAVVGLSLIIPAFIIVGVAENSQTLYLGMISFAISTAFVVTCMTTLTSKYGDFDQKGTVLGIFRSLGALARALGPIIASIAFWSVGSKVTYIFGGVLLICPLLMLQRLRLS